MKIPPIRPLINNAQKRLTTTKKTSYPLPEKEVFQTNKDFSQRATLSTLIKYLKMCLLGFITTASGLFCHELKENSYCQMQKDGIIDYIEPIQTKFKTRKDAMKYATARITEALNYPLPYEHAIYINNANNEILAEFRGTESEVVTALSLFDKLKLAFYNKGATLVHGHPEYENGITAPISYPDFETLTTNKYVTHVIAMDKNGKISQLEKLPYYYNLSQETKDKVFYDHISINFDSFEATHPEIYKELIKKYLEETDSIEKSILKQELDFYVSNQDSTKHTNRAMHRYWRKNAQNLGLEYFSNFPHK